MSPMHQALDDFQIQEHFSCGEVHGRVVTMIEQNAKDINNLGDAHRRLTDTVNKIMITIAKIIGIAVGIQIAATVAIQFLFKSHGF